MRFASGPREIMPCSIIGAGPAASGCWPGNPKSRSFFGCAGSRRSKIWVIRGTRQARHARNEIGNTGVAFPPALVRALEALDHPRHQLWMGRTGGVLDLVR